MRFGTAWRLAVLASLALLVSGQLCMLTTCLPRLHQAAGRAAVHACCRASASAQTPPSSPTGPMPCDMALHGASAPVLDAAAPAALPAALIAAAAITLAPPAQVVLPAAAADTGPPLDRLLPAPAGERAPPQG